MLAYGISALFSLQAFVKFAQTLFDPAVKGDLMLRAHEFMHFMAGRDPASASTELGYPIWAYITSFIWFGPLGIESASWLYPLLCLIVLAAIFALLFNLLPGDLGAARKAIIITGSMPGFALAEQARFLNYGIVVMGGLCLFVFGKSSLVRSFGMVLALLKPALCIPAILAGFLRKPLKTMEALIAAAAIIVAEVMLALQFIGSSGKGSLFSVFARYAPADGAKNSFFVSGDYGVLTSS
jgi:hypothetical protein